MLRTFAALCFGLCAAANGLAQPWPDKPVRIVVPLSTGRTSDALARYVAARLSELWKQRAVIENAPSANGMNDAAIVANAVPDGYRHIA